MFRSLLAFCLLSCALVGCSAPRVDRALPIGSIGISSEGRTLAASTFGHGPRRIYLIAGIHGDEPEGLSALREIRIELSHARHAEHTTVRLLEDLNPDGTVRGSRTSSTRVDLNRAWPASNAPARSVVEPEVAAALSDMERFAPHLIVVLHSARSGPFVNFDGPAEAWAARFVQGANTQLSLAGQPARWRVQPEMGYPTPGSMGSFWGKDRSLPILTIEFARGAQAAAVVPALMGGLRSLLEQP
ncbi:MAG: succinylglutamate desuccinylase/aspartoacylase family protein [Planctomycetota bacterium]|nr:succinylglutamate desuccinylase/aspartoacylase family protein [Planctomycetota bacterium]